jgi:hypothetical protein
MKFVRYLEQWKKRERWRLASPDVPQMFLVLFCVASSLKRLFLGLRTPNEREINGLRSAENKKPGTFRAGFKCELTGPQIYSDAVFAHSVAGVVPERQYIPEKLSRWPGSR